MKIIKRLFNHEYKELKKFNYLAEQIAKLDLEMQKLSTEELKGKTKELKQKLEAGATLDDVLVEAFAVVREASWRMIGEKPYFVQLLGALAIHYGNIAEMKTGEGKTLTSVMPAYLNALSGAGVHIITVNEYLANRDAEWMGKIFAFLGLTVGVNLRSLSIKEKQEVYTCDILYTTNNEIGFDYLRDNMVVKKENRVQRPLNFAIIDEVDSVLIDEARTPLIISGGKMKALNLYQDADRFVKQLVSTEDYNKDEKTNNVSLSDKGVQKAEQFFKIKNLYDLKNSGLVHHLNQALRANYAMHCDIDYVVQEDKIVIVDNFTGRLMPGRAFSEGLHQAIEAKENVKIQDETQTLATITFQNLFRLYNKLAGMTGTAKTEEEEFRNIYNMYVISIPTNKPIIRTDLPDLIYATEQGKFGAIIKEIEARYQEGQPVLVGTIAIETSELISSLLKKKKLPHEVLNAKNHGREAEIIKKAGEQKAITIATNMAGRGTDIKLGEGVKELGGLCVIGTERHESRRIDNQLRGRSGRQGDPGFSQFYVSFEDELMVRFGSERFKGMLASVGFDGEQAIRSKMFTKSIESAQRRVEGNNFDIRKQLLQYDDVMNQQREIMYKQRNKILEAESISTEIKELLKNHIKDVVNSHLSLDGNLEEGAKQEIIKEINTNLLRTTSVALETIKPLAVEATINYLTEQVLLDYDTKLKDLPVVIINDFEKAIYLNVIDTYWMEHINTLAQLREGIYLRGYGQENPLLAYTNEGFMLFEEMNAKIQKQTSIYLLNAEVRQNLERKEVAKVKQLNNEQGAGLTKTKTSTKIGRNAPCPCGSGKKYKQCCGK